MNFAGTGFYDAPFPSDHRRLADGRIDLGRFPTQGVPLVAQIAALAAGREGFGLTSAVFFRLGAAVEGPLPDLAASREPGSPVFLVDLATGVRHPVTVQLSADGGRFGAPNLLAVLPAQGFPLRPRTRYAAVVLRSLGLEPSRQLRQLRLGGAPPGLGLAALAEYREALDTLASQGVAGDSIAGLAVFTTGDPTAELDATVADALARPLPAVAPFTPTDAFPGYCVYESTVAMPTYQTGTPPYATEGGAWQATPFAEELARVVVTIPRRAMPTAGFPTVVFSRTGAGGERPLVDRGPRAVAGGAAVEPGAGLARDFAEVGWAAISIDGPHGGLRNVTHGDEQFLMFNVLNPTALRDNVRQSALELVLTAHLVPTLRVASAACDGAPAEARLDGDRLAIFGHSMGAWIAPLAVAAEPRFRAMILSGAGASWIENVLWKQKPLDVRPLARTFLGYGVTFDLSPGDPVLSLLQWAGESADPQLYGERVASHVLMVQGIVDHYIMPTIANATSLAMGLDLAGPALDGTVPELASFPPLATLLPLRDRTTLPLPAFGNRDGRTAVVVQHAADGIEDGHEALFQTAAPRRQVRCFLTDFHVCQ
jgi:dienelactone hydrolase